MEKIRLQKLFTDAGVLSRRASEREILAGNVTVNGEIATLGTKIDPEVDVVIFGGRQIAPVRMEKPRTYIMLHKPVGYVTTMQDEKGRPTAASLLVGHDGRVYPIGRLDMYSEGLLLFTDDGALANRLMHPAHSFEKNYIVTLKGTLNESDVSRYTKPMTLDGYSLRPVEAKLLRSGFILPDSTVASDVQLTLHEGRNRQIRRMSEILGFTVIRLRRISMGALSLGDLRPGKWRYLSENEIAYLKSN